MVMEVSAMEYEGSNPTRKSSQLDSRRGMTAVVAVAILQGLTQHCRLERCPEGCLSLPPENCIEGRRNEGKSNVSSKGGVAALAAGTSAPYLVAFTSSDGVSVFGVCRRHLAPLDFNTCPRPHPPRRTLIIHAASCMTWHTIPILATQLSLP